MSGAVEGVALLPCPFCGASARRFTIGDEEPNNAGGDVIVCTACQASSHVEFGRKENLVSRWNTRTIPPARSYADGVPLEVAEALLPYTSHSIGCAIYQQSWHTGAPECTCGVEEARAAIRLLSQEPRT